MKKLLCLVLAVISIFAMTACGTGWKSEVTDYSGEVSSNGGFAVVKGDWVYYVNGVELNTAENGFGTPVKGALVRTKLADLGNENAVSQIVVPKLVYSDATQDKGFYIFGDYVYYTSPSTEKNKAGEVLNTNLAFIRTKLDGTDTKVIHTADALNVAYRFVESGEKVYLVTNETVDGDNLLVSYDAATGKEVAKSSKITSYLFPEDLTADYCYYVEVAHDEVLDEDEAFHNVKKFNFDGTGDALVLSGDMGTQGVTFSLIKDTGANLFFSETYVDTSVSNITRYLGVKKADLGEDAAQNYAKAVLLNNSTTDASIIFDSKSYFADFDCIVYHDATYGFIRYNYTDVANPETFGHQQLISDKKVVETVSALTVAFYEGGYVYMTNSDNYYYRVELEALLNGTATATQVTYVALKTTSTWHNPEIVNGFMLAAVSDEPFYGYVYATALVTEELTEDEKEAKYDLYDFTVEENIVSFVNTRIGVVTENDKTAYETYMEETFEDEDEE